MHKRAGLSGADTAFSSWLDVAADQADGTMELFDTLKETCSLWNVKEGDAGLMLAFSGFQDPAERSLVAAYGQHLLDGFPLSRYDGLEGAAGIGAAASLALRWYDSPPARTARELALDALNREDLLARLDSLNNGNALRVLCYLLSASSGSEHLSTAGRILKAMKDRKKEHGCYTISQPYVRSYFDVSAALGTIGIGDVILLYLTMIDQ